MSIPGIFVPQRRGRQLLVDGALRNPVPVSALAELGADVRVAVNLHHELVREIIQTGARRAPSSRPIIATRVGEAIESGLEARELELTPILFSIDKRVAVDRHEGGRSTTRHIES